MGYRDEMHETPAEEAVRNLREQWVKKLKDVWGNWHHDFDVTSQPANAHGVMVVHVTDESMNELLEADHWPAPCKQCGNEVRGQGGYLSCECPDK